MKPFHYQEVAARIRSVLRRRDSRREGPRRVGEIFIDPSRRQVRIADRPIKLANKEFSCLDWIRRLFKRCRRPGWQQSENTSSANVINVCGDRG